MVAEGTEGVAVLEVAQGEDGGEGAVVELGHYMEIKDGYGTDYGSEIPSRQLAMR